MKGGAVVMRYNLSKEEKCEAKLTVLACHIFILLYHFLFLFLHVLVLCVSHNIHFYLTVTECTLDGSNNIFVIALKTQK